MADTVRLANTRPAPSAEPTSVRSSTVRCCLPSASIHSTRGRLRNTSGPCSSVALRGSAARLSRCHYLVRPLVIFLVVHRHGAERLLRILDPGWTSGRQVRLPSPRGRGIEPPLPPRHVLALPNRAVSGGPGIGAR